MASFLLMEIVSIRSSANNMIPRVFSWDWKAHIPYVEMLKYKHQCPTAHLYEYDDHGGTFIFLVFAPNKK